MNLVEARANLENIIESRLTTEENIEEKKGPPKRKEIRRNRLGFLRNYTGRGDYEGWRERRDPEVKFVTDEFDPQMRYKIVKKPRLREIGKIHLKGWEEAHLDRGTLVVIYDHPKGKERWDAVHSIFIPPDDGVITIYNHSGGFRGKLNSWNPFRKPDEIASIEDIEAISDLLYRATTYNAKDVIDRKTVPAG